MMIMIKKCKVTKLPIKNNFKFLVLQAQTNNKTLLLNSYQLNYLKQAALNPKCLLKEHLQDLMDIIHFQLV